MACPAPSAGLSRLDPRGGPPYDQRVMDKVAAMQRAGKVKVGHDRAGATTWANGEERDYDQAADKDVDWSKPVRRSCQMFCARTWAET